MAKMTLLQILLTLLTFAVLQKLSAMDSTDLLPQRVHSPQLRYGVVSAAQDRYDSKGRLLSLSDLHAIELDVAALKSIEPQISDLVTALNSLGSGQLGDKLSLGQLRFETAPTIKFQVVAFGLGISPKWTFGIGIPFIDYENKISIREQGSNIETYKREFGGLSPALDQALGRLSVSLPEAAQSELQKKGYKPLESRRDRFAGDLQIQSLYEISRTADRALLYKAVLNLPTGPQDDPDDLADLDVFGETAVENHLLASQQLGGLGGRWSLSGRAGYRYNLPDRPTKRVPVSNETLPGPETKEQVQRQISGTAILGSSLARQLSKSWSVAVGYEYRTKDQDRYSGQRNANYNSLAAESDSTSQKSRFEVSYSSVKSYLDRQAVLPAQFSMEISDTFAGKNTPRQLLTELTLMMFY